MNKGFTLVELLAVIIILSLISLITGVAVTNVLRNTKEDLSDTQLGLIKSAAESWSIDNLNRLPNINSCSYLTLYDLKAYGLLDESIIDPLTDQEYPDSLVIKISNIGTINNKPNYTYEVNPESIIGCSKIYE